MDALRGVAALVVVFYHLGYLCKLQLGFARGHLAVDLFFGLSGYVMARSYEARLASGLDAFGFIKIRLRRLWPTMAVGALLGALVFAGVIPWSIVMNWLILGLVFMPFVSNIFPSFPINSPAWSVLFELIANLGHALLLRRLRVPALLVLSAVCGAILLLFARDMSIGVSPWTFWLGLARVLFSYCLGIVLWRLARDRQLFACEWSIALLIGGIILAGLVPADQGWPEFVFAMLVSPVILCGGLAAPRYGKTALRLLSELSFPLYAVHFPVINLGLRAGLPPALCLVAVLVTASLLRPLGNLKYPLRQASPLPA